jgi:hypothetical protein
MPMCPCGKSFATVELKAAGRVLVCEDCAAMLEMVMRLVGAQAKRIPLLAIVPRGSVD